MINLAQLQKLNDILFAYPKDNEDLKDLFNYPETQKIAKSLYYGNVEGLSADDFEIVANNIANEGDFLFYCGLYTLNYGLKARKRAFLILSKDLTNRSRKYHKIGTLDYAIIAFNEGKAVKGLQDYHNQSDLEKAIDLFDEVIKNHPDKNSLMVGEALFEVVLCKKNLAEMEILPPKNLTEALIITAKIKKIPNIESSRYYSYIFGNEANIRRSLAENGLEVVENLRESINLSQKTRNLTRQNSEDYARSLLNEGISTRMLARYSCPECREQLLKDSIILYKRARKEGFKPNTTEYGSALTEEGVSNHLLASFNLIPEKCISKAIEFHEKAISHCEIGKIYTKILFNEASTRLDSRYFDMDNGNLYRTGEIYDELTDIFQKDNNKVGLIDLNNIFGKSYYLLKKEIEAYDYLDKSKKLIEEFRSSIDVNYRDNYFTKVIETYKILVFVCIALNKNKEAFICAESAKSRTFLEFLWYKNSLTKNEQSEAENVSPIKIDTLSKIIGNKTLVEYFLLDGPTTDELAIFILKKDEFTVNVMHKVIIPKIIQFTDLINDNVDIKKKLKNRSITQTEYDDLRERKCNILDALLEDLYDSLIKPIKNYLSEEIIIIPHSFLHLLPIQALKDHRYLIQDHKISLAHSASSLEYIRPRNGIGSLVVGNPTKDLKHAEKEAIGIANKLKTKPLIGEKATRNAVLSKINDKNLLHFSCHGFFNAKNPIYSGIQLFDGPITAIDFMNLDMNANLMVLSACVTGLGKVSSTDEIEGLVRSIQIGGCRFVIASLWPVEDKSTEYLFRNFYDTTGNELNRMQRAQVDLINKECDIISWAPFQLYGI